MIYLDHAATSWPKPPVVLRAMTDFLERAGGNPGRSGHRLSIEAARTIYNTRESAAEFFGVTDPTRVIFTHNATHAINIALWGLLETGDLVVTTSVEHNAVMRPLYALHDKGIRIRTVPCDRSGKIDMAAYTEALREKPKLVVANHSSNVTGTIAPIAEMCEAAHEAGALVLVDAAQTAGEIPIDVEQMEIDLLAFTGHKALQGPPGVGGLVISERVDPARIKPIFCGGTGSRSDSEKQPEMLPDKFESGTPNGAGIAGLGAALEWVKSNGINQLRSKNDNLISQLVSGLADTPGVTVFGPGPGEKRAPLVCFSAAGHTVSEIGNRLDEEHGILCRVGLHCAPAAHRTIGSFPDGAVRMSLGPGNTANEVEVTLAAVRQLIGSK